MAGTGAKRLTEGEFIRGLDSLSRRIAADSIFTPNMLPLKLISLGGLRCRNTTEDLDFYYPGTPSSALTGNMSIPRVSRQLWRDTSKKLDMISPWSQTGQIRAYPCL
ncbi:hypothetical protein B0H10DRAFT_1136041 [Mycena sp. CBHHK59/15]|nr:hypothetical protein B0H10DRAFT_1233937 [Mycena sp. CBHHK59/15]KAJ6562679.1 hypothetical protein B0H10DRAFT_1136041 [Mycena sp. CBHHK59/15]